MKALKQIGCFRVFLYLGKESFQIEKKSPRMKDTAGEVLLWQKREEKSRREKNIEKIFTTVNIIKDIAN